MCSGHVSIEHLTHLRSDTVVVMTIQSSMVFAEVSGLLNLYDIARFCQSKRGCRRAAFFRHFGERVQECNGMCDNCAFSKEIVDMDVTEHAKSLVTIVKEASDVDQKSTMLQLVDFWRSRARQPGTSLYHNKLQFKEHASRWYILVPEEVIIYTLCCSVSYCGLLDSSPIFHNMYS
jgi:superfamily II DNA helicase RecQ